MPGDAGIRAAVISGLKQTPGLEVAASRRRVRLPICPSSRAAAAPAARRGARRACCDVCGRAGLFVKRSCPWAEERSVRSAWNRPDIPD